MKLLSVKEISEELSVKESTLYSWVSNGKIPFVRLHGLLRFDAVEVEEWVKSNKNLKVRQVSKPYKANISSVGSIVESVIEEYS